MGDTSHGITVIPPRELKQVPTPADLIAFCDRARAERKAMLAGTYVQPAAAPIETEEKAAA